MRETIKKILMLLSFPADPGLLIRLTGRRNIFPFYHSVSDRAPDHLKHVQQVRNIHTFEQDLEYMLKYFEPLSLRQYLDRDISDKKNRMVLTFDDGLRECHEIIAPILKKKGIPAVFFLNNNFIDDRDIFFRYKASLLIERYCRMEEIPERITEIVGVEKRLIRNAILNIDYDSRALLGDIAASVGLNFEEYSAGNPIYMSSEQIRSLISDGFEIGSHSIDHPRFSRLPEASVKENILMSIEDLCTRFNLKERYFSFPFSSDGIPPDLISGLLEEGSVDALLGTSGIKKCLHDGFIQRLPMEKFRWPAGRLLKTEYLYYFLKAPFGKNRYRGG